ncbi:MAG TPA: hypothetical protein VHP14_08170 [Anaerolineales bacterium]|nr:hypothetical protein [Anaerolineales bacterium]
MAASTKENEAVTTTQAIFLTTLDPMLSIAGKSEFFSKLIALLVCEKTYQLIGFPRCHRGKPARRPEIVEFPVKCSSSVNEAHHPLVVIAGTPHSFNSSRKFFPMPWAAIADLFALKQLQPHSGLFLCLA